ncbi:hypothetical protein PAEPH01_0051 [Pancytospora epiphaga]|nr:hypothetical protein PAEPH01_0051 [Pancytospora epiphaga]
MENNEDHFGVKPSDVAMLASSSLKIESKAESIKNDCSEKTEIKKVEFLKKRKNNHVLPCMRTSKKGGRSRYYIYPNIGSIGVNIELNNPELNTWGVTNKIQRKKTRKPYVNNTKAVFLHDGNNWETSQSLKEESMTNRVQGKTIESLSSSYYIGEHSKD